MSVVVACIVLPLGPREMLLVNLNMSSFTLGCIILCCWFVFYFNCLLYNYTAAQLTTQLQHASIHSARPSFQTLSTALGGDTITSSRIVLYSLHCSAICSGFVEEKAAALWESLHSDVSGPSVSELIMMYASLRQITVMYCSCLQTCLWLPSKSSLWFRDLWRSLQRNCSVTHHFNSENLTARTHCMYYIYHGLVWDVWF